MTTKQFKAIEAYAKKAMDKSLDPQHDYAHVDKVRKNALKIVKILKIEDEIDANLLQASCLLHDILFVFYQNGFRTWLRETRYLKKVLPEILPQFNLAEADRYLLSEAVYRHTWNYPFKMLNKKHSLYAQIVQDADFMEFIASSRIINFKKNKNFSKWYKFLSLFSGIFIKRIKKNMDKYINIPEIIEYFTEDYK